MMVMISAGRNGASNMSPRKFSNVIGFDDAPFEREHRGAVTVVGAVFADLRLDGVIIGTIEKDGDDAARNLTDLVLESKFAGHIRLIMLQGIAMGGFNVVDVPSLNKATGLPVLVVSRVNPDMAAIRKALLTDIPDGKRKWALIKNLGDMEPVDGIFIQRSGISRDEAMSVIRRFSTNSRIPEPIRVAHLIGGAISTGQSRGAP